MGRRIKHGYTVRYVCVCSYVHLFNQLVYVSKNHWGAVRTMWSSSWLNICKEHQYEITEIAIIVSVCVGNQEALFRKTVFYVL